MLRDPIKSGPPARRIWLDRCDETMIVGWIDHGGPVASIEVRLNDKWLCSVLPNIYRKDLELAGLGDGRRGFEFPMRGRLREGHNIVAIVHLSEIVERRVLYHGSVTGTGFSPTVASLAKERWCADEDPAGLTWGRLMTGDSLWDVYQREHHFRHTDRIVEFGPGYGRLIKTALERKLPFGLYTGVELSRARVVKLTREFGLDPRCTFEQGDINNWFTENRIDVVLCSSTFEHLYPDCREALANLRRQLAGDALVFVDFIDAEAPHCGFDIDGRTYLRYYSRDELHSLFAETGYAVKAIEKCRLGVGVNGPVDRLLVIAEQRQ
jgi:SAM-dependent methyltransferase